MAKKRLGSCVGYNGARADLITENKQLRGSDSGKIHFLEQPGSGTVLINLPKLSSEIAGWNARFFLRAVAAGSIQILGYGVPVDGTSAADGNDADVADTLEFAGAAIGDGISHAQDGLKLVGGAITNWAMIDIETCGKYWYFNAFSATQADIVPEN